MAYAAIWDMDGVLVDTGKAHYQSWTETLAKRGVPLPYDQFSSTFGMNNTTILKLWLGAMSVMPDTKTLLRCTAHPIGSYAIALDARGLATVFCREYELTVLQLVQEFGTTRGSRDIDWTHISTSVRALWDNAQYTQPVRLVWIVQPNPDADPARLAARFLPWESCHFELTEAAGGKLLRESGYHTFPFMCPRWDITGEDAYGTSCPGMIALGDVKQLQLMQRRKGQAISKMVDPPLVGLPELKTQKTSLLPGDITYVTQPQHGLKAIHEVGLNLQHLTLDIREVRNQVQRAFYEDLFLMMAREQTGGSPITAEEVRERQSEKLLALGPVLERTNDELLNPLVDRTYEMMARAGLIPPAPAQLHGVALKVEYISVMAQAQKLVGVSGQDRFMQSTVALAEQFPEAKNKINVKRVIDNYGTMLGVDPRIIRTDDEADVITQQQAKAQQDAANADSALKMATAARQASQAQMGKDSALDRVVSGALPTGQVA